MPFLNGSGGGVYQYSLTLLETFGDRGANGFQDELVVFADDISHPIFSRLDGVKWKIQPESPPVSETQVFVGGLRSLFGEGPHRDVWRSLRRRLGNRTAYPDPDKVTYRLQAGDWFRTCAVSLMFYPLPLSLSFESGVPFVMAVHDLQHRLQPEFPEVSADGEWERREYLFRNGARYATLLLADSEVGKEDILNSYGEFGITADRVKVLPFLPASYLPVSVSETEQREFRKKYSLPSDYLFYPAQFWPHKNHARIIRALALLKQKYGLRIPIVLCGAHENELREQTFQEVQSLASELGVDDQVLYLGYVADEHIAGLYAGATALVMPTFFGPTNIPILEAWSLGCPVVTSDIRGVRDQAGDAAVLVDPRSVESIADGVHRVWTDESLRGILAERGRQRLAQYTPADYRKRLIEIIEEAKARIE